MKRIDVKNVNKKYMIKQMKYKKYYVNFGNFFRKNSIRKYI